MIRGQINDLRSFRKALDPARSFAVGHAEEEHVDFARGYGPRILETESGSRRSLARHRPGGGKGQLHPFMVRQELDHL